MSIKSIYVVDIETTGLNGEPKDHVVEVGVYRVTPSGVSPVYSAIVKPYYELYDGWADSWVFQNTDLCPEHVLCGVPQDKVRRELKWILDGMPATSFNYEFDFDKFLNKEPWGINNLKMPCIMKMAGKAYGNVLPCSQYSGCPNAQSTYRHVCPENPAELPGSIELHRALEDAHMESCMLHKMIYAGDYTALDLDWVD